MNNLKNVYHQPVMLQECIKGLDIKPDGIYVDLTFGGGGHSKEILKQLTNGKLYGFDQDEDAKKQSASIKNNQFEFVNANFRYFKKYLRLYNVKQVDGILADLGVSSHQINIPERGFSTRFNTFLDMRMDQNGKLTAENIINTYTEKDLINLLSKYGEIRNAKTLAAAIILQRIKSKIKSSGELKKILEKHTNPSKQFKYFAQVFQAFRIVVNDELNALKEMISQANEVLKPGGKFVIMSYHSLEDRLVKNYFSKGKFKGEVEKDFYGNMIRPLKPITKKPIIATNKEIKLNNRARSAKLRIAEKI